MIQLKTSFVSGVGGFSSNPLTYTQLKRNDKVALYERSRDGKPYDYEVFLIKVKPKGTKIFKKILDDDQEHYPTASQFGRFAWSYGSKGFAYHMFHELTHGKAEEVMVPEDPGSDHEDDTTTDSHPIKETPSKAAPVTEPAKPYKGPNLLIPVGEFSTKELASHNQVQYPIAFLFRKEMERQGKIKFSRKQKAESRGKPTDIFVSI